MISRQSLQSHTTTIPAALSTSVKHNRTFKKGRCLFSSSVFSLCYQILPAPKRGRSSLATVKACHNHSECFPAFSILDRLVMLRLKSIQGGSLAKESLCHVLPATEKASSHQGTI